MPVTTRRTFQESASSAMLVAGHAEQSRNNSCYRDADVPVGEFTDTPTVTVLP